MTEASPSQSIPGAVSQHVVGIHGANITVHRLDDGRLFIGAGDVLMLLMKAQPANAGAVGSELFTRLFRIRQEV